MFFSDATNVECLYRVIILQNNFLDCLRCYCLNSYPNEIRRCGRLLLRLASLRSLSAKFAEKFLNVTLDSNVRMNALVREMIT